MHPPFDGARSEPGTPTRARYMLDANAFDHVLDRAIDPAAVRGLGEICITTVQHGELLSVPEPRRRQRLLGVLSAIDPTVRPAFVEERFHDGMDRRSRRASRGPANRKDAAIAEVAALEGCTLVTDDKRFRARAIEAGLKALSCAEAFAGLDTLARRDEDRRRERRPRSGTGRGRR